MTQEEPEIGAKEEQADTAEKLLNLINRIEQTAKSINMICPERGLNSQAWNLPLWHTFNTIAKSMELNDHYELRDNYITLCDRTIRGISSIDIKKDSIRERWIDAIKKARSLFDAEYFNKSLSTAFDSCCDAVCLEKISTVSERLQLNNILESTDAQLKESLETVRSAFNAFEATNAIPENILNVFKHYLQQLEMAYTRFNDFGEEMFWRTYRETYTCFLQTHLTILPSEVRDDTHVHIQKMTKNLECSWPSLQNVAAGAGIGSLGLQAFQIVFGN